MLVIFVTTALVRRRNTRPRSFPFLLFGSLVFLSVDGDADNAGDDDVAAFPAADFRLVSPLTFDLFGFAVVADTFSDERVRRTTAFAVSTLRRFRIARFVPTELMVVLLVDTTLKPRAFVLVIFCFSRIFVRFGSSILFLLFGFGVKFGKI